MEPETFKISKKEQLKHVNNGKEMTTNSFAAIFIKGVKTARIFSPDLPPETPLSNVKLVCENAPTRATVSKSTGNTGPDADWIEIRLCPANDMVPSGGGRMPADDGTTIFTVVLEAMGANDVKVSCVLRTSHRPSANTDPAFDQIIKQGSPLVKPGRYTVTASPVPKSVRIVKLILTLVGTPTIPGCTPSRLLSIDPTALNRLMVYPEICPS